MNDQPIPWWMRAYLLLGAAQALSIGVTGFLTPEQIQIPIALSPLNARFIAALYLAAAVGVLLAALGRRAAEARLFVMGFGSAASLILPVSILHWPEFTADGLPHRETWFGAYLLDIVPGLVIVPAAYRLRSAPARHRLTRLFQVESIALGGLGLLLLLAPTAAPAFWPWALTPTLAQLYSCFFLAFAVGAQLAARESSATAIRNFAATSLALTAFVLAASLLHLSRFQPGPATWAWFASLAVGMGAFTLALLRINPRRWTPLQVLRTYLWVLGPGILLQGLASVALRAAHIDAPPAVLPWVNADRLHAIIHITWGLAMMALLAQRGGELRLVQLALVFGVFYTILAFLGMLMHHPFGLELGPGENAFHVVVGPLALLLGLWATRALHTQGHRLGVAVSPPAPAEGPAENRRGEHGQRVR